MLSDAHSRADRGLHRMALPDLLSLLPQAGCWRARQHPLLAGGTAERRDKEEIRSSRTSRARKTASSVLGPLWSLLAFTWEGKGPT